MIVNELFLTATARAADVVFPASAFAEKEGVVVNCERRLQRTVRALAWRKGVKPDWEILQAVAQALGAPWKYRGAEDVFREIAKVVPGYLGLHWATLLPLGPTWSFNADGVFDGAGARAAIAPSEANGKKDGLALLSGGMLFLQGNLSHRGSLLPRLAKAPRAFLHPAEAGRLGIAEGDRMSLAGPGGAIELPAALDSTVPEGSVFVPYAQAGVELNRLGAPNGSPLRVRATRVSTPQTVGA